MSSHQQPSPEIAKAYTIACDGWTRATAWVRSSKSDHFEAIYKRETYGPQAVKVYVRNTYIVDATAAMFEINMQLRSANDQKRRREGALARRRKEAAQANTMRRGA